jgi:hypothetical protein
VIQGNTFDGNVNVGGDTTVGGATASPGSAPGNTFTNGALQVGGSGTVIQGNTFGGRGAGSAIELFAGHATVGGARPDLGNVIEDAVAQNLRSFHDAAGISIGYANVAGASGQAGDDNTVENNLIENNLGDGGVAVYNGTGNTIFRNRMLANALGINLGGGPFRYNRLGVESGPNNLQAYPNLFGSRVGRSFIVNGGIDGLPLTDAHKAYRIDIYAQAECGEDSLTPGQGAEYLRTTHVTTGVLGTATFRLALPDPAPGNHALTATATAADGSTSEFSPCLTIGRTAPQFTNIGVTVPNSAIVAAPPTPSPAADSSPGWTPAGEAGIARVTRPKLVATLRPFCPPITTGSCAGTIVLKTTAGRRHPAIGIFHSSFALAPGQLGTLTFALPNAILRVLRHARQIPVSATLVAHDGQHHHKRIRRSLVLRELASR